ncbi:Hypothetical_protein [Hexamita inflata]|uniref:Hypothetical_protein n=1 Tax=Hexamita inflata TaxID=28002 RepID=A0AA86U2Z3_9EUKA|nr:Hypothetical protein HINF_LOCUS16785 [Hexamita inflata]CAI9929143.1 Hypothetical protein HINF_LOCUS16788 [Hexamita inflata]
MFYQPNNIELEIFINYVIPCSQNIMTHQTETLSTIQNLNLIIPSSSHKTILKTAKCYHKLISILYLVFKDHYSEQPPQTTQVSSALEQTLLTSEVIFVTTLLIFINSIFLSNKTAAVQHRPGFFWSPQRSNIECIHSHICTNITQCYFSITYIHYQYL